MQVQKTTQEAPSSAKAQEKTNSPALEAAAAKAKEIALKAMETPDDASFSQGIAHLQNEAMAFLDPQKRLDLNNAWFNWREDGVFDQTTKSRLLSTVVDVYHGSQFTVTDTHNGRCICAVCLQPGCSIGPFWVY